MVRGSHQPIPCSTNEKVGHHQLREVPNIIFPSIPQIGVLHTFGTYMQTVLAVCFSLMLHCWILGNLPTLAHLLC